MVRTLATKLADCCASKTPNRAPTEILENVLMNIGIISVEGVICIRRDGNGGLANTSHHTAVSATMESLNGISKPKLPGQRLNG